MSSPRYRPLEHGVEIHGYMATIGDVKLSTNETSVLLSSCPSALNYSQGPGTRPTGCGKAILKMPSNRSTTAMFLNPFVSSGSRQVLKSRLHITNQLRRILSTRTVRLFKSLESLGLWPFVSSVHLVPAGRDLPLKLLGRHSRACGRPKQHRKPSARPP